MNLPTTKQVKTWGLRGGGTIALSLLLTACAKAEYSVHTNYPCGVTDIKGNVASGFVVSSEITNNYGQKSAISSCMSDREIASLRQSAANNPDQNISITSTKQAPPKN